MGADMMMGGVCESHDGSVVCEDILLGNAELEVEDVEELAFSSQASTPNQSPS